MRPHAPPQSGRDFEDGSPTRETLASSPAALFLQDDPELTVIDGALLEAEEAEARVLSRESVPKRLGAATKIDWEAYEPRGWYPRWGRRVFNVLLLVATLPLALLFGGAIALLNWVAFRDPRQIFFLQPRVGTHGRIFRIYKFRTMRTVRQAEFSSWGEGKEHLRVTRFGRFLRNTHLDELPQLINVLRGEMSIVGPRPEMLEIEAWAGARIEGFHTRLAVPPGITGYAQVTQGYTGRDVRAYRHKFEVSDDYRARQSLALDVEILLRTAVWMLRGRGWHWQANAEPPQTGAAGATGPSEATGDPPQRQPA